MVRQVRMLERYMDGQIERSRRVFAFGSHELATEDEIASNRPAGIVTTAAALNGVSGNTIRIIMDELLVGNNLEEVACRGIVDTDALARVPLGATPEDIARCSSPDDVLPKTCPASNPNSMCICQNPAGCAVGVRMIAMGMPVGVSDLDQDGAADETQMIDGAIGIKCGPGLNLSVLLNLNTSYWNPSGDQNRPALGGFDALGPAIVVTPDGPLPTNVECQLVFADGSNPNLPAIVDKEGEKVCTPLNGDIANPCTPGDVTAFKFKVEPFKVTQTSFTDGIVGVPRDINMNTIDISMNVPIAASSLAGVTVTPALPANATISVFGSGVMARTIRISGPPGTQLQASTLYTITLTTALTDTYNQPLPAQLQFTFTTAP